MDFETVMDHISRAVNAAGVVTIVAGFAVATVVAAAAFVRGRGVTSTRCTGEALVGRSFSDSSSWWPPRPAPKRTRNEQPHVAKRCLTNTPARRRKGLPLR